MKLNFRKHGIKYRLLIIVSFQRSLNSEGLCNMAIYGLSQLVRLWSLPVLFKNNSLVGFLDEYNHLCYYRAIHSLH